MNIKHLRDFQNLSSPELDFIIEYIEEIQKQRDWK